MPIYQGLPTRTPRLGPLQRAAHAAIQRENRLQAANEKARRAAELKRLGISVKDETTAQPTNPSDKTQENER
jgi:hypothetical protein